MRVDYKMRNEQFSLEEYKYLYCAIIANNDYHNYEIYYHNR